MHPSFFRSVELGWLCGSVHQSYCVTAAHHEPGPRAIFARASTDALQGGVWSSVFQFVFLLCMYFLWGESFREAGLGFIRKGACGFLVRWLFCFGDAA